MPRTSLAALLGFAFVAAWGGLGFGWALLCLLGAAVFALAVALLAGELDLERLRRSADAARAGFSAPPGR